MKRFLVLLVAVFVTMSFSSVVLAEGGNFGLGLRAGFASLDDDSFTENNATYNVIDNGSSGIFGANATYILNRYFSFELSVDYIPKVNVDFKPRGQATVHGGDMSIIPVMFTARLHLPTDGDFWPYIGAGVGCYFNDFNKKNSAWLPGDSIDYDDSFSYHVAAGAEFFVGDARNVSLNFDFKYIWSEADLKLRGPSMGIPGTYDVDLDTFMGTIGLKFFF